MLPVERLEHRVERVPDLSLPERDGQLVALADIAHIDLPLDADAGMRRSLGEQGFPPLRLHLAVAPVRQRRVELVRALDQRRGVVVLDVGDQEAHGRGGAGAHRHQDGGYVELLGKAVGVHRPGAAEGDQHEVARVVAPLHRDPPERADHGAVGDLHDAERHLDRVQPERVRAFLLDGLPCRGLVQAHLAAEEMVGVEALQDEVRIGDGRLGSSLPVAGRSRVGARALRPHAEHAARIHPGDGAAARADLDQVDHGRADGIARPLGAVLGPRRRAHFVFLGDARRAVLDQPGLGRGAAHVEGQDVVEAEHVAEIGGDDDPGGGARLDHEHGLRARGLEGEHAAARLHDEKPPLEPRVPQAGFDAGKIALDDGPDAGVDEGGAGPEILAELRRHLGGKRDQRFGKHLLHDLARAPLMLRIAVGMEVADAERLHAFLPERPGRLGDRPLVERRHHGPGRVEPLRDAEAEVARRQRPRLLEQQVVERGPDLALDLQHVPEPVRGDEAGGRELPLDDRVGGHGGSVDEVAHIRGFHARLAEDAPDRREKAHRGVARRGGHLRDPGPARLLVDEDAVGEGPADIDAEAIAARHGAAGSRARSRQRAVSASSTVQERVSTATL